MPPPPKGEENWPVPSLEEKAVFCRQLATLMGAGVPVVNSLEVLGRSQERTAPYSRALVQKVGGGVSLSHAMSGYPDVFDAVFVGQVRTGEESGRLVQCLQRLSFLLERQLGQARKVQAALTYPAVLFFASISVLLFFVIFVVPALMPMFESLKIALPWPTRVLLVARKVAVPGLVTTIAVAILAKFTRRQQRLFWASHPRLRRQLDSNLLQIPIVGKVYYNLVTARLLQAMATLLDNGLTLSSALTRTSALADNKEIEDRILDARRSIEDGERLSAALGQHRVFPKTVVMVLVAAEEASNLSDSFQRMANFYDDEVQASLDSATALAEPIIMVVMGSISGFIAIAAVLPTLELIRHF